MFLQEQSQARSRALLCTDNTQCFTCFVCFFPDHQSYIYYLILNQQIYPVIVRMMILDKSDSQRKIKHKTCRYFVYIQHALFYLLCLPLFPGSKLPDACRENDILIKSSWYPSNVLMIICKFWFSRKWFMISSDKSDDPQKFLNVSPRGSADILESYNILDVFWWYRQRIISQKFLILRDFLSFGNCDCIRKNKISISFQKWHPPKCPILSFEHVAMLFIFL